MSSKSFEKLQENEQLHTNYSINMVGPAKTSSKEVVYKPTTIENGGKRNSKFQSFKPGGHEKLTSSLFLYRTAIIANILPFCAGIGFSWTSPVFPKLHGPESPLNAPIDASQESIIAAILCIGAIIGPFPAGYLADKIGRKKTLIALAMPMVVALGILAFTDEVKMYYFARLLYGAGCGGAIPILTMYMGEITEDHNRGKFCCMVGIFLALGVLFPLSIGPMLSIRNFCLYSLVPLQIFLIFFFIYGPESPIYLIKADKIDQAVSVLIDLRDKSEDQVQKHVKDLQIHVESEKNEKGGIAAIFRSRNTKKAFMIAAGLLTLQQVAGINAVTGFMENIFLASGSSIPPQIATTVIGIIQVLAVLVTTSVVEKLGRKFLLLSSIIGAIISLASLGFYFYVRERNYGTGEYLWWLPITSLVIYIVSFNLGLGPIPWAILSEIFPDNIRASAAALVSSICFAVSFVVTLAFPILSEILGMSKCFWIFGNCCICGFIFTYFVVPETKGKNFAEIQQILGK